MTPRMLLAMRDCRDRVDLRDERRWASFKALFANAYRNPDRKPAPFTVRDFLPDDVDLVDTPQPQQPAALPVDMQISMARAFTAAMSSRGRGNRGERPIGVR